MPQPDISTFAFFKVSIGFVFTVAGTLATLWALSLDGRHLSGWQVFGALLLLGFAASLLHGILWVFVEKYYGTRMLGSTYNGIAIGSQAILLSVTLTVPIALLPALALLWPGVDLMGGIPLSRYFGASCALIGGGAISHLIMYGTKEPRLVGLKERFYPPATMSDVDLGIPINVSSGPVTAQRALAMEFLYCIVYFPLMVIPFKIIAGKLNLFALLAFIVCGAAWLATVGLTILLIGQRANNTDKGVQLRGQISAMALSIALIEALLFVF